MDELAELLAGSQVTLLQNSTAAEHPRFSSYKAKSSSSSQEARRRKFLEAQKSKRFNYANHARGLATNEWEEDDEEKTPEQEEDMDAEEVYIPPQRCYKNQLMLSEWLVEVPDNLAEEWWLVLCPIGKRCLVVSSRGSTKVYTKGGYRLNTFPSLLPGGNKHTPGTGEGKSYCLLDCIYNELEKAFYILDVMCFNAHPCFDSDTEFRFYWLQAKVTEIPGLQETSKKNPYKFIPLPYYECKADSIKTALWSPLPFAPQIDGLLFYHKRTHYTPGSTPLVGWLKGFMVPEMLNIEIPPHLEKEKPLTYTTMQMHCPEAFAKNAERKEIDKTNMQYED